ncbi:MAG: SPOR domain-containing protein [Pseudomonadota bacterium]
MPRDYKNRPAARRKKASDGPPRWAFALGGFALGLCVAVGAYVEGRHPGTFLTIADSAPVPDGQMDAAEVADASDGAPRPRFEFYNLLPEMEVSVPVEPRERTRTGPQAPQPQPRLRAPALSEAERAARLLAGEDIEARHSSATDPVVAAEQAGAPVTAAEPDTAEPAVTPGSGYMLQVGSFRELSDADRLKAALALNGHRATIHTARMDDNSERHRVRLGPFPSRDSAKRVSVGLADGGVRPLLIKIDS